MPNLNNVHDCTLDTCPIKYATVDYDPSLAGNALFLALFSLFLSVQILQLWRYRTWSYSFAMISGLLLEVVGYVGRVQMHYNPFLPNPFLIYLICLTIGPVFFAAAIYLTFSRIVVHSGPQHSRFSPKVISLTFMSSDFIALVLQAVGGAIADTAPTQKGSEAGTHIMVAGLSFQVLSLLCFIAVACEFFVNVRKVGKSDAGSGSNPDTEQEQSKLAKWNIHAYQHFLATLALSTLFVLTRSIFRVAELSKGFGSKLANEEIPFMILEGAMIVLATGLMTAVHPGSVFGRRWSDAGWKWGKGGSRSSTDIEGATVDNAKGELKDVK